MRQEILSISGRSLYVGNRLINNQRIVRYVSMKNAFVAFFQEASRVDVKNKKNLWDQDPQNDQISRQNGSLPELKYLFLSRKALGLWK